MRILLVEDDALLGDGIRKSLSHLGFTVDWLRNGREAENALGTEEYAAIVLDIGLPERDGLAILQSARTRGVLERRHSLSRRYEVRILGINIRIWR